jgi:cytosine/adenosine deaminase-related metal-dependent hydrolase
MNAALEWLEQRSHDAPAPLRERALWYLREATAGSTPDALAAASLRALETTLRSGTDRGVALDLLAADALVTLALQAKAEADPSALAGFARRLRKEAVGSA